MRENNLTCLFWVIALLSVCGCCGQQQSHATGTDINVRDLRERPVIGELGLPLGTAAEIRATIVAGDRRSLGDSDRYFLLVTEVNSRALATPKRFSFSVRSAADGHLANNRFDLYKMEYGEPPPHLIDDKFRKLDEGYVGRVMRLGVYETGEFSGIPADVPLDLSWQDHGFGFSTSLVVLAEH